MYGGASLIFFDLDGTLIDHKQSEYLGIKAFHEKYKQYFVCEEEAFHMLWCQVSDKHFNRYLNGEITFQQQRIERIKEIFYTSGVVVSDEMAEEYFKFYLKMYEKNWRAFDDVEPCLLELSSYRLGIISNGDFEQQSLKLERLGIKGYFECIITAGDIGIAKPDIRLFEIACNKINQVPQECFYIGDDLKTDILPCKKIGMTGIWINRKNEQLGFDNIIVINSLKDLKDLLHSKYI